MLKSYKYRIYPNEAQKNLMAQHFGCTRKVYNHFLNLRTTFYAENKNASKKSLNYFDTQRILVEMKNTEEYSYLYDVNAQALLMSLRNLDNAFTKFFKHTAEYPTFKSRYDGRQSFQAPQGTKIKENKIILSKFQEGIKIKLSREIPENGKIKTTTIIKTPTEKYYASILIETPDEIPEKFPIIPEQTIGIDLGIKEFLITSDGEKFENPKFFTSSQKRLAVLQKRHARKKKGGKNREKARLKVAKHHEYISNQRAGYQHKVSHKLVSNNHVTTFMIEDLNVKGMMKNHCLAKAIADVGWSGFVLKLMYKADWSGKNVFKIGRFEPSSKLCSVCGHKNTELTLADRAWECPECGTFHDRDINAARNIRNFGLLSNNSGQGLPVGLAELSGLPGAVTQEFLKEIV